MKTWTTESLEAASAKEQDQQYGQQGPKASRYPNEIKNSEKFETSGFGE